MQCDREFEIGRFYVAKRDWVAAINRFKTVVQKCQTSPDTPEALAHLAEAFLALGLGSEAQTAVAVLERKFPDAHFTREARNVLNAAGMAPTENEKSWIARAFR